MQYEKAACNETDFDSWVKDIVQQKKNERVTWMMYYFLEISMVICASCGRADFVSLFLDLFGSVSHRI